MSSIDLMNKFSDVLQKNQMSKNWLFPLLVNAFKYEMFSFFLWLPVSIGKIRRQNSALFHISTEMVGRYPARNWCDWSVWARAFKPNTPPEWSNQKEKKRHIQKIIITPTWIVCGTDLLLSKRRTLGFNTNNPNIITPIRALHMSNTCEIIPNSPHTCFGITTITPSIIQFKPITMTNRK